MPAVIAIEGSADNGRTFQIEEEVVRVGRAPGSQIVLTDRAVPDTAVAVRYQGGRYHVYNRSTRPITVGGVTVAPNQSRPWPPGEAVVAWPGAALRLVVTGDPAPAPRVGVISPLDLGTDKPAVTQSTPAEETPPPAGGKKTVQIVVIVSTWVVVVGLLAYKVLTPETATPEEDSYTKLAADLDAQAAQGKSPLAGEVAAKLRDARTADRRGHANTARKLYSEVVVRLRNRPAADKPDPDDPLDRALKFARERARALGGEE
jgi:hypothetical protein